MNDKRPVNLDIGSIELPITAIVSILHRASGVFMVAGIAVLLWLLDTSLASEESFNSLKEVMASFFCKLLVWVVLAGLIYHTVAGIKHLIMDLGIGETMRGGETGAKAVIAVSTVLILFVGALLW